MIDLRSLQQLLFKLTSTAAVVKLFIVRTETSVCVLSHPLKIQTNQRELRSFTMSQRQ